MIVTETILKILDDYTNINAVVNSSIKYRFTYNQCPTDVFYTTQDGLNNQLLFSLNVDETDYLTSVYFSKDSSGEYYMSAYLPPELYKKVKFKLLLVNGKCDTIPYFEEMCRAIKESEPIPSNHHDYISGRDYYRYGNETENPFFETFIRKKMSEDMKHKVLALYGSTVAKQILKFCGNTKTLRFTSDITKSKDILTFLNTTHP